MVRLKGRENVSDTQGRFWGWKSLVEEKGFYKNGFNAKYFIEGGTFHFYKQF